MITLKEIKRYPDTNSVEATWVSGEVVVKCHSYDQVQMDMLAADLGSDLAEYQHVIDEVQANMIPTPSIAPEVLLEQKSQECLLYLYSTDWYYARLAETGQEVPQDVKDKRIAAREYLNQ